MFQRLTNLLFGYQNETTQEPTVPKPGSPEVDEEDWLLVNAPVEGETFSEPSEVQCAPSLSKLVGSLSTAENCASSVVSDVSIMEPEVPVARGGGRVSQKLVSQAGTLVKVTQVGRIQRAQARASRRNLARNCIQRQNHVRQRLPQHCPRMRRMKLQQPNHRNLSH